jgi:hypothetical protein
MRINNNNSAPGCMHWKQLLKAVGDLDDETQLEDAQRTRFLTLDELKSIHEPLKLNQRRTRKFASSQSLETVLGRKPALADVKLMGGPPPSQERCGASPDPAWTLSSTGNELLYEDRASAHPMRATIPVMDGERWVLEGPSHADLEKIRNKWVYFHGESTIRQQCKNFVDQLSKKAAPTPVLNFTMSIRYGGADHCTIEQPHNWEYHYQGSGGVDPTWSVFDLNEAAATWFFSELNTTLTCDWKMHTFRRYDRWLLKKMFAAKAPDVYIWGMGLHDCFWKVPRAMGDEYNAMQARIFVRYLADFLPESTRLMWLSTQKLLRPWLDPPSYDKCVEAINSGVLEELAMRANRNMLFVDRDRVSSSLLGDLARKSNQSLNKFVSLDGVHLANFIPEIIGQYLWRAITCS